MTNLPAKYQFECPHCGIQFNAQFSGDAKCPNCDIEGWDLLELKILKYLQKHGWSSIKRLVHAFNKSPQRIYDRLHILIQTGVVIDSHPNRCGRVAHMYALRSKKKREGM